MALQFSPQTGTIVICDFAGFQEPEIIKRRPVVVVSPSIRSRPGLCAVVPFSTTPPKIMADYHCKLVFDAPLPPPYDSLTQWVKGDMLYTVSLRRLSLPLEGKDETGKRNYVIRLLSQEQLRMVRTCMLHGLGLGHLIPNL